MPSVRDAVPQIHLRLANPMEKVAVQYLLAFLGVLHLNYGVLHCQCLVDRTRL